VASDRHRPRHARSREVARRSSDLLVRHEVRPRRQVLVSVGTRAESRIPRMWCSIRGGSRPAVPVSLPYKTSPGRTVAAPVRRPHPRDDRWRTAGRWDAETARSPREAKLWSGTFPLTPPASARLTRTTPTTIETFEDFWEVGALNSLTFGSSSARVEAYEQDQAVVDSLATSAEPHRLPRRRDRLSRLLAKRSSSPSFAESPMSERQLGLLMTALSNPGMVADSIGLPGASGRTVCANRDRSRLS